MVDLNIVIFVSLNLYFPISIRMAKNNNKNPLNHKDADWGEETQLRQPSDWFSLKNYFSSSTLFSH